MTEDEMRRVREQQEQQEVRQHERRQELRHETLAQAERDEALSVARVTAMFGAIPSVAWIGGRLVQQGYEGAFALLFSLPCILFFLGLIVMGLAAGSGLFAFVWFHGTGFSVRRMAITLALLGDAVLFGWVLVLTH